MTPASIVTTSAATQAVSKKEYSTFHSVILRNYHYQTYILAYKRTKNNIWVKCSGASCLG